MTTGEGGRLKGRGYLKLRRGLFYPERVEAVNFHTHINFEPDTQPYTPSTQLPFMAGSLA